jgi:hypothetical protein
MKTTSSCHPFCTKRSDERFPWFKKFKNLERFTNLRVILALNVSGSSLEHWNIGILGFWNALSSSWGTGSTIIGTSKMADIRGVKCLYSSWFSERLLSIS